MATTDNGLPYPTMVQAPDVPYWLEQLAATLDPLMVDTGVVQVPLLPGVGTGALYARRIGPLAILMFEGVSTSGGGVIAELPPEFQPGGTPPSPRGVIAATGTDPAVARVVLSTNVTLFGYISDTLYYGSVTYPVV